MVPRGFEWVRDTFEYPLSVMVYLRGFPVKEPSGPHYVGAVGIGHRLVTEADPEYRRATGEFLDNVDRDARFFRGTRSGGYHNHIRGQFSHALERAFVVPVV